MPVKARRSGNCLTVYMSARDALSIVSLLTERLIKNNAHVAFKTVTVHPSIH